MIQAFLVLFTAVGSPDILHGHRCPLHHITQCSSIMFFITENIFFRTSTVLNISVFNESFGLYFI